MRAQEGALLSDARDVTLRDVHLEVANVPAVRAHNVSGLSMDNVTGVGPFDPPTGHLGDL
jgi:hypothetical protein